MNVLITGGAGFIGSNLAERLIRRGDYVTLYDNLCRAGSEKNLEWLRQQFGSNFRLVQGDIRDAARLSVAAASAEAVFHLAGQVAVTTSVANPREDFEVNALGTFNALEAARHSNRSCIFFFSSTNKVYGGMEDIRVREAPTRYEFADYPFGVPETRGLDFHSPYGCSKGSGDQYVRDYYRIYGLPTIVFRQSCIYGFRQFGVEDQGWLAHFLIAASKGRRIAIYGDGKQVRDVLFIEDLVDAILQAVREIRVTAGQIYNIGGGPENTVSIWSETRPLLHEFCGRHIETCWEAWRPGDQRVYVSDVRKAGQEFGWSPRTKVNVGLKRLWDWISANPELFP